MLLEMRHASPALRAGATSGGDIRLSAGGPSGPDVMYAVMM